MRGFARLAVCVALTMSSGPSAADEPETTNHFLARCKLDFDVCRERIAAEIVDKAFSASDICIAAEAATPGPVADKVAAAVVSWLQAHPERRGKTASEGIVNALAALYPCG